MSQIAQLNGNKVFFISILIILDSSVLNIAFFLDVHNLNTIYYNIKICMGTDF